MIKYADIEITGMYTEGFEITIPSPLTLQLSAGKLVSDLAEINYPEIEFTIESDPEILVIYDVYIVEKELESDIGLEVIRTEIGIDVAPIYYGEAELFHTLLSLQIPPGLADLNDIEITVRNFMRVFPVEESGPNAN